MYATPNLLGVHILSGGKRIFRLSEKVDVIYDLFAEKVVAKKTHVFDVGFPPASRALFSTGEEDLILSEKTIK